MLGYFVAITLVLTALTPFVFTDVFANSFVVNFDKTQYITGDSLTISGEILDFGMPVIALSIYDPDGKILSANNLEITSEKTFSKTINLDAPFYEKSGEYKAKLDYGQISENHYFVIENEYVESEIILEEFEEPEIILLYTDQKQYTDKDVIKITGLVSALDSPSVLIGVYDPFGMPAGFYFGTINSDLEFSTSFLVKAGVNFRIDGIYSIKAHYAETEATSFFEYYEVLPNIEEIIEEQLTPSEETTELNKEKTDETSQTSNVPSNTQSNDDIIAEDNNSNSVVETPKNNSQNSKSPSENNSIVKDIPKEVSSKENNPTKNKIKTTNEKINPKIKSDAENKKQNNLTVEDVELGKILNQINLTCDSSTFTDTISYYDGMGPALYRLCKFDSSLNFFNESLIDNPNDVEILVNKGSTLGKLGYFSEAIVYYDQAIVIDPTFLPAKNNKANALANLGHLDESISLYNEILRENPNYFTAKKNLDIALSLIPSHQNVSDDTLESNTENIIQVESSTEKTNSKNDKKQNNSNFFEEFSLAFSSLGSLFGFLN